MSILTAYWWSPVRSAHSLGSELRSHPAGWARLMASSRRLPTNFGDELTPYALEIVTGRRIRWAPVHRADVVAVGSIVERYLRTGGRAQVWGSGLRQGAVEPNLLERSQPERFLAVRGPRTRQAMGLPENLPLGDPGLVVADYGRATKARRNGIVLIPHFRTFMSQHGLGRLTAARSAGARVVPPTASPLEVLAAIRSADLVLTSSLHGLILSDATATRVILVSTTPEGHDEPDFKFVDYGESVGCVIQKVLLESALCARSDSQLWETAQYRASTVAGVIPRIIDGLLVAGAVLGTD
jgi:pyruvyltransferase